MLEEKDVEILDEFIRITKNKSLICFTINEGIYKEYGFDKKIEELKNKKRWKDEGVIDE